MGLGHNPSGSSRDSCLLYTTANNTLAYYSVRPSSQTCCDLTIGYSLRTKTHKGGNSVTHSRMPSMSPLDCSHRRNLMQPQILTQKDRGSALLTEEHVSNKNNSAHSLLKLQLTCLMRNDLSLLCFSHWTADKLHFCQCASVATATPCPCTCPFPFYCVGRMQFPFVHEVDKNISISKANSFSIWFRDDS